MPFPHPPSVINQRPAAKPVQAARLAAAAAVVAAASGAAAHAQALRMPVWIELEGQYTHFARNDVRKPNDASGDLFSVTALTGEDAAAARLSAELPIPWWGSGHRLRLTYAPLSLDGEAVPATPIRFQDATFAARTPTGLRYTFDTWRATYSVPLFGRTDPAAGWSWRAGGTLAIRDAEIRLSQGATVQSFSNVGLVPLLHLSTARVLWPGWIFEADLDGAPGPGGAGLWDGAARLRWALGPGWSVAAGLRHLRGGVDNDELYNKVSATSATLSARFAF